MKRSKVIISVGLVFLVIAVGAFAFSNEVRRKTMSTAFAKVQIGDTKESVVQMLGQPEEVQNCYDSDLSDDLSKRCVETYWYTSFLERWGFSFTKDGKLIDKTYNASL